MKTSKVMLFLSAATWLGGCSGVPEKAEPDVPANLSKLTDQDAVVCHYHKYHFGHDGSQTVLPVQDWYFMRHDGGAQSYDPASAQREIWSRDRQGRAELQRVLESEKVVLEYNPGDLAATGKTVDWSQAWSIIDSHRFGKDLVKGDVRTLEGVPMENYQSREGIRLVWITGLKLPFQLATPAEDGDITQLQLVGCNPLATSVIKPVSQKQLLDYRHIDYTDLGDMESDPGVQRILGLIGDHHHHH
jgi:hypothetical protein